MGTKVINLSPYSISDTIISKKEITLWQKEQEIKKSKDGKYMVTAFNRGYFYIYNIERGVECAKIKTCYTNEKYDDRIILFNSLEKMVGFSKFPYTDDIFARYTDNVYYLRLHYFSETAPILIEKKISFKYNDLFISENDEFLFAVRNKIIDIYDANTLDFKASIDIPTKDAEFFAQEMNYFIFKCNDDKYSSLQYYQYIDGKFKFIKKFPEQDIAIFSKAGTDYFAKDYVNFKNYIAVKYNSMNGFNLVNIIDKKTQRILFSRFVSDFIPNEDCSAFIVSVKTNINTNDFENYEPGRKHIIYNLKDTAGLFITDVDLDPEYTEKFRAVYRNRSKERERQKQLLTNTPIAVTPPHTQPNSIKQKVTNEKLASTEEFRELGKNVKEGNLNEIIKFVENGYSFQPPSDFGFSILTYAVNYLPFRKDIFKYLVDNGADVNYINENTTTALSAAINKNNTEAVKMLLESGANPNFREDWTKENISKGMALLEKAIMSDTDKKAIIKLLIDAGANVNNSTIDNSYGIFTTLGFAIGKALDRVNPDYELIKLLIDAGADVNGKVTLTGGNSTNSGTILDYVETKNPNSPIVTILKNAGAKSSNANSTSKKYITIGDITDVFSNNSSNNNKAPENERNVDKQINEPNTATKENTGTSKQDAKDGNVIVPNYTNNNYKSGGNLSLGDFDYSDFNFKDGTSGTLYRGAKTNKYFISVDGISPTYYKSQDYAIKALYIYKKYNEITVAGKE